MSKKKKIYIVKTFEYLMIISQYDANLMDYGKQGWELVTVTAAGDALHRNFYFKRPRGKKTKVPKWLYKKLMEGAPRWLMEGMSQ